MLQLREHHDVVDAVQELWPEVLAQFFLDLGLHALVSRLDVGGGLEAGHDALGDVAGTEVGGHDDDRVLEVDHAALGVGQATVFEDLQ